MPNIEYDINDDKNNNNYLLKKLILACDYFPKCTLEKNLEKNIQKINENANQKLLFNTIKSDMERKTASHSYIKSKKKLFSFLGLWSNEEYFYNKNKYEIKYKLVNHFTSDYTRVLFEPIINIDYYFPEFTKYNYDEIFRKNENIKTICNLTDLSFAVPEHKKPLIDEDDEKNNKKQKKEEIKADTGEEEKKEEDIIEENKIEEEKSELPQKEELTPSQDYNELYDVKLNYYKGLENITSTNTLNNNNQNISSKNISEEQIKDFIIQKYSTNILTNYDIHVEACLINASIHRTGLLFIDSTGIGFYSYEKIHSSEIYEENYDKERLTCFGSIFRPQNKKYENYFIHIPYNSIELILKRRYFFRRNALEIFTVNKKSYLFNINENKFKSFYENIKHYMQNTVEDINIFNDKNNIGFYNKQTFLKLNKDSIPFQTVQQKDMSIKSIYDNWSKWKMSSLKLLMLLNLYASRSFHDLNQYPVFPWIITDYTNNKISISDNKIIRPLDTPMGMIELTPDSKERKKNYFETWATEKEDETDEDESNADRYRSHYSTSLYTTYYLVRVFPFSYIRVELQGKSFDDPNRLFNSMKSSFNNSLSQKSDLRELIPEFFYFPEMFYNSNHLNLGMILTKDGEKPCGDVTMPEWSNNNGYIFISKHKEMLESPEISENIHNWIDLIFGYKQKGKEAKKIYNLFAKESYEEYEDKYKEANEKEKFLLCKFMEFGVTPSQLYKNAFNKRMTYAELKSNKYLLPNTTQFFRKNEGQKISEKIKELTVEEVKLQIYGMPSKISYSERGKNKYRITTLSHELIKIHEREIKNIQMKKSVALVPTNQVQVPSSTPNSNNNTEEEKYILDFIITSKGEIKLTSSQNRINNPPSIFYNNGKNIAFGGAKYRSKYR